ncbi:MAG: hypothetical protein AAGI92_04500 [Pseudomonadota bacterium]
MADKATILALFIALIAVGFQICDSRLLRMELENANKQRLEERIDRARDRIVRRDSGDTGKGREINFLADSTEIPLLLDVSCQRIGIVATGADNEQSCTSSPFISDLFESVERSKLMGLSAIKADHTWLYHPDFSELPLRLDGFKVEIMKANAVNANLTSEYGLINFTDSDLSGASVYANADKSFIMLTGSNISGAYIDGDTAVEGIDPKLAKLLEPIAEDACIHQLNWTLDRPEPAVASELPPCVIKALGVMFPGVWYWADYPPLLPEPYLAAINSQTSDLITFSSVICLFEATFDTPHKEYSGDHSGLERTLPENCRPIPHSKALELFPEQYGSATLNCAGVYTVNTVQRIRTGTNPSPCVEE